MNEATISKAQELKDKIVAATGADVIHRVRENSVLLQAGHQNSSRFDELARFEVFENKTTYKHCGGAKFYAKVKGLIDAENIVEI